MSARLFLSIFLAWMACSAPPALAGTRDPMRPPAYLSNRAASPSLPGLDLQSIQYSARQRQAIINGRSVHEGDGIGPWRVLAIHRTNVVIASGDTTLTLMLFPAARKRMMSNPSHAAD